MTAAGNNFSAELAAVSAELRQDYARLMDGSGCAETDCDAVIICGPDAAEYLHGQMTADVTALDVGAATWTFLLQPTGKVDAYGRLVRASREQFVMVLPVGWSEASAERLDRFRIRVDCEISSERWTCYSQLVSAEAQQTATDTDTDPAPDSGAAGSQMPQQIRIPTRWGSRPGLDTLGKDIAPPAGLQLGSPAALEMLRVQSGRAVLGREVTPDALPAEVGSELLEEAVSFSKGCYVGQELVERMHSRAGKAPKQLLGVEFSSRAALEDAIAGAESAGSSDPSSNPSANPQLLHRDDADTGAGAKPAAEITSIACIPSAAAVNSSDPPDPSIPANLQYLALALVHRAVEPGDTLFTSAGHEAKVRPLPFA